MKLYTKEQLKQAIAYCNTSYFVTPDDLLEDLSLTPIELPSDEEIAIKSINPIENCYSYKWAFQKGAKWMKDFIISQK